MKKILKLFVPPIIVELFRKIIGVRSAWKGDYISWKDAQENSSGYDSDQVIDKVKSSLLKVKNGIAVYERDSVIFDEIKYSWPLLAGLMYAAAKSNGVLNVCDFGGSLGSTYFQNRKFLKGINNVSWSVVEQEHFVVAGKKEFENEELNFFYTIQESLKEKKANVLLLSSVIQYISDPYKLLDNILDEEFDIIILDRTPFSKTREMIKVQVVAPSIYDASYPCWFLSEGKLLDYFMNKKYKLVERFDALDGESEEYKFKGFIFEK